MEAESVTILLHTSRVGHGSGILDCSWSLRTLKIFTVILLIGIIIVGDLFVGAISTRAPSTTANCFNPPPNNPNPPPFNSGNYQQGSNSYNPNPCHLYIWNHFPNTRGVTPNTSLFNNDTSYYFSMDLTGVTSFIICANFIEKNINEPLTTNETLVLQYFDGANWVNLSGLTMGGDLTLGSDEPDLPTIICSPVGLLGGISLGPSTQFRIAGNLGVGGVSIVDNNDFIVLSELFLQFYFPTVNSVISCTATTRLVGSSNLACARNIPDGAQSVTIGWRATNSTGSGCGANDNCWRTGSSTCSFALGATSCTVSATFSPSFTGSVSVIVDYNAVIGSGSVAAGSFIVPILT